MSSEKKLSNSRLERRQKWWTTHKSDSVLSTTEGTIPGKPSITKSKEESQTGTAGKIKSRKSQLHNTTDETKSKEESQTDAAGKSKSKKSKLHNTTDETKSKEESQTDTAGKSKPKKSKLHNTTDETKSKEESQTDTAGKSKPKKSKLHNTTDKTVKSSSDTSNVAKKKSKKSKIKQYVLFVGNLPFSATKDDIMQHFNSTGGLVDVRLLTKKDSGESRGCAYVEFTNADSHKHGLLLHESFLNGRKINVEFTSPGRKTPRRVQRLKEKNERAARFKKAPDHIWTC